MALTSINLSTPKAPTTPGNPTPIADPKKLKKVDQQVEKIKKNIMKNVGEINKSVEDIGIEAAEKTAKMVCLLRLDMVSDVLDKINPKLASQIDKITDAFERETPL